MKTIGLLGGMSWESSLEYYRLVNQKIKERRGGFHSAKVVMVSVDFAEIETLQMAEKWDAATELLIKAAQQVEAGGGECLVICTNTMHKMADAIQEKIAIPLLHIADATAQAIQDWGIKTVGLLGTRFTMEQDFYRQRLQHYQDITVLTPNSSGRETIHTIIYEELVKGVINDASREAYLEVIKRLHARGAEGIILGCTEIGLLIQSTDTTIPLFDTTQLHAEAAVKWALDE